MGIARYAIASKKSTIYNSNASILIERLKKIRALNSDPSLFGIESYTLKRSYFNKISLLTKL